ncbi:hypothetical protein HPB48_001976 [Haemaphysalis longicornis]|uniref:Uncharacterized protein n=1 Tax=Haemaphysalis longicornis TaxID=44386 RepID=A0A9J6G7L0_HAELO|nr:hypothetical protein HPB48_001976 [Haemaphysalis longicornis]
MTVTQETVLFTLLGLIRCVLCKGDLFAAVRAAGESRAIGPHIHSVSEFLAADALVGLPSLCVYVIYPREQPGMFRVFCPSDYDEYGVGVAKPSYVGDRSAWNVQLTFESFLRNDRVNPMNDSPGIAFVKCMVASYLVDCATDGYLAAVKEIGTFLSLSALAASTAQILEKRVEPDQSPWRRHSVDFLCLWSGGLHVTSAVARAEGVPRAGPRAGAWRGPDDRLSLALLCGGSCTSLVLRFLASGRRDVGAMGVAVGALTCCKGEVVARSGTPEKSSEVVGADTAVSEGDGAGSALRFRKD